MAEDWGAMANMVLSELERLNKNYEKLDEKMDSYNVALAEIKTKVIIFSSIGGGIVGFLFILISKFI